MKITTESQIDRNKLAKLFASRGHGILAPQILQQIFDVFDRKLSDRSVFQCGCGDLFIIANDAAG